MEPKPIKTVWMWREEDGAIWGLMIDEDAQRLEWTDSVGCSCGDSFAVQTFADWEAKGPRYGSPPPDVIEEVEESLHAIRERLAPDAEPVYEEYWT